MSITKRLAVALVVAVAVAWPTGDARALSAGDRATVQQVLDHLNSIRSVKSRFTQVSSNGATAQGTAYLSRPGRLRLEYDPPAQVLMVADGRFLAYYDKELQQASHVPLGSSPAGLLVRNNVTVNDLRVTNVQRSGGMIRVGFRDRRNPEDGELMLVLDESPLALRQWAVRDPQGVVTTVTLTGPRYGVSLPRSLFYLNEPW